MSELLGLAFLLAVRARDKGLRLEDIVFLVECQFGHAESLETLCRLDDAFLKGGVRYELERDD